MQSGENYPPILWHAETGTAWHQTSAPSGSMQQSDYPSSQDLTASQTQGPREITLNPSFFNKKPLTTEAFERIYSTMVSHHLTAETFERCNAKECNSLIEGICNEEESGPIRYKDVTAFLAAHFAVPLTKIAAIIRALAARKVKTSKKKREDLERQGGGESLNYIYCKLSENSLWQIQKAMAMLEVDEKAIRDSTEPMEVVKKTQCLFHQYGRNNEVRLLHVLNRFLVQKLGKKREFIAAMNYCRARYFGGPNVGSYKKRRSDTEVPFTSAGSTTSPQHASSTARGTRQCPFLFGESSEQSHVEIDPGTASLLEEDDGRYSDFWDYGESYLAALGQVGLTGPQALPYHDCCIHLGSDVPQHIDSSCCDQRSQTQVPNEDMTVRHCVADIHPAGMPSTSLISCSASTIPPQPDGHQASRGQTAEAETSQRLRQPFRYDLSALGNLQTRRLSAANSQDHTPLHSSGQSPGMTVPLTVWQQHFDPTVQQQRYLRRPEDTYATSSRQSWASPDSPPPHPPLDTTYSDEDFWRYNLGGYHSDGDEACQGWAW